jgi:hypothetical protein
MSIRVMSEVWRSAPCEGTALIVLLALADFADDGGECWPSMPVVAKKARLEVRQAYRIMAQLQRAGLVSIEHRGGGRGLVNRYRLNIGNPVTENTVSRNTVSKNTVSNDAKTLSWKTQNPVTGDSCNKEEPSRTTKEPSGKQQPAKSPKLLEREEGDRRARLTDATNRGLRNYEKHPLEPWEIQQGQIHVSRATQAPGEPESGPLTVSTGATGSLGPAAEVAK